MATTNQTPSNFPIAQNGYVAFDATSLRDLINQRLTQQSVFTDQNYTGSNMSAIIEIVAYSYHLLMFYLNQSAAGSQFTQADVYENINRIVKALNYNPVGYQTATLAFQMAGSSSLPSGSYTIPRYSYFQLNGIPYTFGSDVTFTKNTDLQEAITTASDDNLLYQGSFQEYPTYLATGEPFELVTLAVTPTQGTNSTPAYVDHFNIDVYVKDNTQAVPKYVQYTPVESLFLEDGSSTAYEIRLNENGRYEIKFGNNIHGKQLNANDEVAIYYLQSDGTSGQISADSNGNINVLAGQSLLFYNSARYSAIISDVVSSNLNIISSAESQALTFSNSSPSTTFQDIESVDSIRTNALNTFKTQYRLITTTDFETYTKKNFGNLLASVKCVSNTDYINEHIKYFFDLGVEKPNLESRVLLNQVKFSSSCNFNNVYLYCVPKLENVTSLNSRINYLSTAQKQLLLNKIKPYKLLTSEVVFVDPVYTLIDIGVTSLGEEVTSSISDSTYLQLAVSSQQQRAYDSIKQSAAAILQSYFSTTQDNLGLLIDVAGLSIQLAELPGVVNVQTIRTVGGSTISIPGLSLIAYNPVYPNTDATIFQQNLQLPYFKFPILNNASSFINKIKIVTA